MTFFADAGDLAALGKVPAQAVARSQARLLAYCLLANWHLLLWPRDDGELSRFVGRLTLTHTQRWRVTQQGRQTLGAVVSLYCHDLAAAA